MKEQESMQEYFGMNVGSALEALNDAYTCNTEDVKQYIKEAIEALLDFSLLKQNDETVAAMSEEYKDMYLI